MWKTRQRMAKYKQMSGSEKNSRKTRGGCDRISHSLASSKYVNSTQCKMEGGGGVGEEKIIKNENFTPRNESKKNKETYSPSTHYFRSGWASHWFNNQCQKLFLRTFESEWN